VKGFYLRVIASSAFSGLVIGWIVAMLLKDNEPIARMFFGNGAAVFGWIVGVINAIASWQWWMRRRPQA
jgi:hypothetical protein